MESSGFFQSMWDPTLFNPTTQEQTGWWDKSYVASEFSKYFSLFIGNGVFISPTNQLKVIAGTGNNVIVSEGWAFIKGNWYHNDSDLNLAIANNSGSINRVDSIRLRLSESDRSIAAAVFTNNTELIRGEMIYDLELAKVTITPGSEQILNSNIVDSRPDEAVCGFVKGLVDVVTTKDLFLQLQAIFDEWFDDVKNQLYGDLGVRLQLEFTELNNDVKEYYSDTQEAIDLYKADVENMVTEYYNNSNQILDQSNSIVENFVDKDFILVTDQVLNFENNICVINDERITNNTLVDVYFTKETINEAMRCSIYVDSENGRVVLTAGRTPASLIVATIRVRVR